MFEEESECNQDYYISKEYLKCVLELRTKQQYKIFKIKAMKNIQI